MPRQMSRPFFVSLDMNLSRCNPVGPWGGVVILSPRRNPCGSRLCGFCGTVGQVFVFLCGAKKLVFPGPFYFSLYRCVCRVPQSHSASKNLCNHCGSRRCGRGTLVPQLSLTSHSHSGNSSYCCVSRSSLGNIIQTHSVRTPLIRFPRVLFRPLVSMSPSCLR